MNHFSNFTTPQIVKMHAGKVRDSYRLTRNERMIVVTDRLSAFDNVLKTPIPMKGAVLNGISNFWFDKTRHIIKNHFISSIDPNITIVKELEPVRVEMIVRGYLTGSMWRYYKQGKREFSGVTVGDGLTQNCKFPAPLLTPTTKEDSDREISPGEIVASGLCSQEIYDAMCAAAIKLFEFGSEFLAEKGIVLVDTKYEFGLLDGELVLMDEIHTPDSSRFWRLSDYQKNPATAEQIDKEFVRQWLIENKKVNSYPDELPEDIVAETTKRYLEIYQLITGSTLEFALNENVLQRIYGNLVKSGLLKKAYIACVMGSPADEPHAEKILSYLKGYDVYVEKRVVSAHKNGEEIVPLAEEYNNSIEPGVVIAIAGRSNGLGGALSANLNIPVINCPPFKDTADILANVNSSLMMPSNTPAMTVIHPDNAAAAALRALNIPEFRKTISKIIGEQKDILRHADSRLRGR